MLLSLYRILSLLLTPLLYVLIIYRLWLKKEDFTRYSEKFGKASVSKNKKNVIWFHVASVGEMQSIVALLRKFNTQKYQLLVTSGTITSAKIFKTFRLKGVIHQYAPLDSILFVKRFIQHWQPKLTIFVESEIWPNLITEAAKNSKMALINAKLSNMSFKRWKKIPNTITQVLNQFNYIVPSSTSDYEKLKQFTNNLLPNTVNLKYCASALKYDETLLHQLERSFQNRKVLLCSSTHYNEENQIFEVFQSIKDQHPSLALIIVPRHPNRGKDIYDNALKLFPNYTIGLRSEDKNTKNKYDIYIADTIGELGIFYKFAKIAFVGATLVKLGGHNVIEPAHLDCCILIGPNYHNCVEIIQDFKKEKAIIEVKDNKHLAEKVMQLFNNPKEVALLSSNAYNLVNKNYNMLDDIYKKLKSLIEND